MSSSSLLFEKKYIFENREIVYQVFDDKPSFPISEVHQVHGNKVIRDLDLLNNSKLEADGIYKLFKNNLPATLAIKTADCLPVIFIGLKGVSLIHSGWKGLKNDILIDQKIQNLEVFSIFIGPSIQQMSYEVGEEFLEHFKNYPDSFTRESGSIKFSLQKTAIAQMRKVYPKAKIEASDIDTFNSVGYNSFRKNKTPKRNYNLLNMNFANS